MKLDTLFDNFDLLMDASNAVPKMRDLILQLAVQGKLVEQDPTDEPAGELLKRIKAEKKKLITEGKIKKQKPLLPINKDEIPYELPQGWEWVRLGEIGLTQTGSTPPTSKREYYGNDYAFIKPADISEQGVRYNNGEGLSKKGIEKGRFIKAYSVLMVCIGGSIGKVNFVDRDCSCNQQINAITPCSDVDFRLINYNLASPYFQNQVLTNAPSTTLPILSKGKWDNIPFPLPPLSEQKRIVSKVDQLIHLCDQLDACQKKASTKYESLNDAALEKLLSAKTIEEFAEHWQFLCNNFDLIYNDPAHVNKLRQAVLQLAVQGKLVPQDPTDEPASELLKRIKAEKEKLIVEGKIKKQKPILPITEDEILYELPQGWKWSRLGEILAFEYGKGLTKQQRNEKGNIPVYGSNGIVGYHDQYLINRPCIIIGRKGSSGALNICYTDSWTTDVAYYCSPPKELDLEYIYITLKSLELEKLGKGIKPGLNRNEAYLELLSIPPLSEQKRIVSKVDQLMNLCDELETRLNQSKKDSEMLMQAVLQEAFGS